MKSNPRAKYIWRGVGFVAAWVVLMYVLAVQSRSAVNLLIGFAFLIVLLIGSSIVFAITRAEIDQAGLADRYVSALMVVRFPGYTATAAAVLVAARGSYGWMALCLAIAALLFGASELLLRYYRTNTNSTGH